MTPLTENKRVLVDELRKRVPAVLRREQARTAAVSPETR